MKCWKCDKEASAICAFCGVALCSECVKTRRYVTGIAAQGQKGWGHVPSQHADALVVENAIWCGNCTIKHIRRA
jgi:hypothetical protein